MRSAHPSLEMNGNIEEEEAVLRAAEYERMPLNSSVTLARTAEGGVWEKTEVIHVYFAEQWRSQDLRRGVLRHLRAKRVRNF